MQVLYWTYRYLPGKRLTDQPVFVLTSSSTFSAPEGFAYTLQQLERATIVGEQTGGGAHPGGIHRLSEDFIMFVASARVINPITETNWEGTGVVPNIEIDAGVALEIAQKEALKLLYNKTEDPDRLNELEQIITRIENNIHEIN